MAGDDLPDMENFQVLSAFLRSYLHQDFHLDYKTHEAALRGFCKESSAAERDLVAMELAIFVDATRDMPFETVREIFCHKLGSGWYPESRGQIAEMIGILDEPV